MTTPEHLTHIFYDNGIPQEVEKDLVRIYQSAFSVNEYFQLYKPGVDLKAVAICQGGQSPEHIFVYAVSGREISLLNELVEIPPEYLQHFADLVFARYPAVNTVNLNRMACNPARLASPRRLWTRSEDTVIALPGSCAEYRAGLGKRTRNNLSNYGNRLRKIYHDFAFNSSAASELDPLVVSRIIEMNRSRMRSKNIKSGYDADLEHKIIRFSQKYGYTGTISIGGNVVAGTIRYEVGDHCYLEAIAHDPRYDSDRVGQICLYLTIQEAIERGRKFFHFLWGEYEYKYRFLGVKQDLFTLSLYRSEREKLLSLNKVVAHGFAVGRNKLVYWSNKYLVNRLRRSSLSSACR